MARLRIIGCLMLWSLAAGGALAEVRYPVTVRTIPKAFRGHWDELQSDQCRDREPRYSLERRSFATFEAASDVTSVTLRSPTEIDIHVALTNDKGKRIRDVVAFRLVDGGRGLADRPGDGTVYRRCPANAAR